MAVAASIAEYVSAAKERTVSACACDCDYTVVGRWMKFGCESLAQCQRRSETSSSITSLIMNFTWAGPGSNPGFCGQSPALAPLQRPSGMTRCTHIYVAQLDKRTRNLRRAAEPRRLGGVTHQKASNNIYSIYIYIYIYTHTHTKYTNTAGSPRWKLLWNCFEGRLVLFQSACHWRAAKSEDGNLSIFQISVEAPQEGSRFPCLKRK
jgi:hypothetical protein